MSLEQHLQYNVVVSKAMDMQGSCLAWRHGFKIYQCSGVYIWWASPPCSVHSGFLTGSHRHGMVVGGRGGKLGLQSLAFQSRITGLTTISYRSVEEKKRFCLLEKRFLECPRPPETSPIDQAPILRLRRCDLSASPYKSLR